MLVIISLLCLLFGIALLRIQRYGSTLNENYPDKERKKMDKFAILIPARDESKVIRYLLESIKNQSYKIDFNDVYVIVESKDDKTVDIVKEYGGNIFWREDLNKKRKGYAIDEVIKKILKIDLNYDAYFIFDADNILSINYFKEMIETYNNGYDIGIGYRNTKNGNKNVIAACSSLTFSMINSLSNKRKMEKTCNCTISGTGFYISGEVIKKLGGYPFYTLTEDYELTLYAINNNLTTCYNEKAEFFDEQPLTMHQSIRQRTRWIRGYIDSRIKYIKDTKKKLDDDDKNFGSQFSEVIGIYPYGLMVIGALLLVINYIYKFIISIFKYSTLDMHTLLEIIVLFVIYYLILFIISIFIIHSEKKKINLSKIMKLKACLFNPIFLSTYIYCFILAIFNKDLEWKKIEHGLK